MTGETTLSDSTIDFDRDRRIRRRRDGRALWRRADAGASVLVLEKQALIGGSTCDVGRDGLGPEQPGDAGSGVQDSYEDAMAHFEAVVGDVGPASSYERRHAFLTAGPEMVGFLQREACGSLYCPGYSDYYSDPRVAATRAGRSSRCRTTGKQLGDWHDKLQPGLAKSLGMAVMTNEARVAVQLQPQRRARSPSRRGSRCAPSPARARAARTC